MITENLSTLKIHKLTQEQYDKELANGTIDENALYLTPDKACDPCADYDMSKGTIEERLTALGFKEGIVILSDSGALTLTRQGNYVIGDCYYSTGAYIQTEIIEYLEGFYNIQKIGVLGIEFRPVKRKRVGMCRYATLLSTDEKYADLYAYTDGTLAIDIDSESTVTLFSIDAHFGYEAAPLV